MPKTDRETGAHVIESISEAPLVRSKENSAARSSGIGSLTSDAVAGVTDIVELVHRTALGIPVLTGRAKQGQSRGLAGLVYKNIRNISELVGDGIDALIDQFDSKSGDTCSSYGQSASLAILNGVLGDHLVNTSNPLAIKMCFRREGKPLDETALAEVIQQANGNIAIMVHGSCRNDVQWKRNGHDHGVAVKRDLGFEPIYLYYNTGRHVSENGQALSGLLEDLIKCSTHPLNIVIIAHSMGGLVARSACYYSKILGHNWLKQVRKLVCLGTPHHGTHLEKAGNLVDVILDTNRYSAPFSRLGKIRSSGVTDLRFGSVVDDDWKGRDRFQLTGDKRVPVPLPKNVACYAMAATAGKSTNLFSDQLVGDGLVTVNSALGRHKKPEFKLEFPTEHQWVGRNMGHLSLLDNPDVYETLKRWLSA